MRILLTLAICAAGFAGATTAQQTGVFFTPNADGASSTGKSLAPHETPSTGEMPAADETPSTGEMPAADEPPSTGELPAEDETPSTSETPIADEVSSTGEMPAVDETPSTSETPIADEVSSTGEMPAVDETPSTSETPIADEVSSTGELPAVDEAPSTSETPIANEAPSVDELPVADQTSSIGELPVAAKGPSVGELASIDELPVADEIDDCLHFVRAITVAREAAPEVSIARARSDIADGQLLQEKGTGRPNISAYARAAQGDSGLVDGRTNTQAGLQLSQRLFDFGQGRQRRKSAEARVKAAELNALDTQTRLGAEAGHAFIAVLANRDLLAAANRRVARYQTLGEGVDRRLNTGLITLATANSIKAEAASARAERVDRLIALESALIEVATLTNIEDTPCHEPMTVMDELPYGGGEVIDLASATNNSVQLNAARSQVDAAAADYRVAQRIRRPEVSLQVVGAYQYDSLFNRWKAARRVGIDISMPLFAGGSYTGRRREASAQVAAAQGEVDRLTREFSQKIRRSTRRVEALTELALARRDEMVAQAEEVDAVRRQFEAGVRPYQDYERAEAALSMSEIGDIEARYQALQERLTLAALLEMLPQ